jgi:GNAT superfamily N-acetyltransferase
MAGLPSKWHIRPVLDSDYEQWSALYHGYREFYKQERSEDVVNTVWSWIHDPNHVTQALVAVSDTGLVGGIAHHRQWPRPLLGTTGLYLDDLFTRPELRGHGIATLLINALSDMAKQQGLNVVRWTTAHDNTTARRLYDSLASATQKVTYDKVPGTGSSGQ